MIRHVATRYLSLERVLERILEQWENIHRYYIIDLLKGKTAFNGNIGVGSSEIYDRIKTLLNNQATKIYMAFVICISNFFKDFIVLLQSSSPVIHRPYNMETELIRHILETFISCQQFLNDKRTKPPLRKLQVLKLFLNSWFKASKCLLILIINRPWKVLTSMDFYLYSSGNECKKYVYHYYWRIINFHLKVIILLDT